MKYFGIGLSFVIVLLFTGLTKAQKSPVEPTKAPKVVIGIVIENMRPDYIQRYWNKFEDNGFKKLYTEGAVCTNVRMTLQVQNYASGTATLFTGVNPSSHGIINKKWYDKFKEQETDCTEDEY